MKNKLICKGDFFMIVKQKSKVIPIEKSSTHYKMYKGGKLWLTAGITTLSMAGMMIATGELQIQPQQLITHSKLLLVVMR